MTKLLNEITANLQVINDSNKLIEETANLKNEAINRATDKIKRLTYEECILLLDPLNDMPDYIYETILNRLRTLWRINKK